MKQSVREYLEMGTEGHAVLIETETKCKTKEEWIAQARKSIQEAESYGASTPNQMREAQRDKLREALTALGQRVTF